MTEEIKRQLIEMCKFNLELIFDYMDEEARTQKETQLGYIIDSAVQFIETEGITLDYEKIGDLQLVVMYVSYLYDKRNDGVSVMPRALRYNLNNRLFQEKASV